MAGTIVVYYSYTGNTKKLAEAMAEKEQATLQEVEDQLRPTTLQAYTVGCVRAMLMKRTPIESMDADLYEYDRIIIMAPVWAGYPAPSANNVFDLLPRNKDVEVYMVSQSGKSSAKEKVKAIVTRQGCRLLKYEDIACPKEKKAEDTGSKQEG